MPRRHAFQHVNYHGPSRPSARALDRALIAAGYSGPTIQFGQGGNKRLQLARMRARGVPCPPTFTGNFPCVMRTDNHRAGSGFWLCHSAEEMQASVNRGATHAMEFIANAREFRVHVAFGKSIKLTEKLYDLGTGATLNRSTPSPIRSHANGWHQMPAQPNAHKQSLRRYAKQAVEALGFDFGAVDILMREPSEFFVLEVNTAPALTDPTSDTLARYVRAFVEHGQEARQ